MVATISFDFSMETGCHAKARHQQLQRYNCYMTMDQWWDIFIAIGMPELGPQRRAAFHGHAVIWEMPFQAPMVPNQIAALA